MLLGGLLFMPVWGMIGICAAIVMLAGDIFAIRAYLTNRLEQKITAFQDEVTQKHNEEVQNLYWETRGWRHDFHNHIQTMKAYRALGQDDLLDAYLNDLEQDLTQVDQLIRSGNGMVDAILNSKLSLAEARKIHVSAKAVVPVQLIVTDVDLCIILSNLLDNAMEACAKLEKEDERFIRVYIDVKRDLLYLSVTNAVGGKTRKLGRRYLSAKGGYHGLGLLRVDRLIEKYKGYCKRRDEEGVFTTEIMLPIR